MKNPQIFRQANWFNRYPNQREPVTVQWDWPNHERKSIAEHFSLRTYDEMWMEYMSALRPGERADETDLLTKMTREHSATIEAACAKLRRRVIAEYWPWTTKVTEQDRARFLARTTPDMPPPAHQFNKGLFDGHVLDKDYKLVRASEHDCLMWTGGVSRGGGVESHRLPYGTFWLRGQGRRAHIVSSLILGGGHWPGEHVDHMCRRSLCVQPYHLLGVPPDENQAARWGK